MMVSEEFHRRVGREIVAHLSGATIRIYRGMTQPGDVPQRPLGDELGEQLLGEYHADDESAEAFRQAMRDLHAAHPEARSFAIWKGGDVLVDGLLGLA